MRLLTGDDPAQQEQVRAFLTRSCSADAPAFVNHIVIVETVWVLESAYDYATREVAAVVEALLRTLTIEAQDSDSVWVAVRSYRAGADFADALIASTNAKAGCEKTFTFDRKAAKRITHLEVLA